MVIDQVLRCDRRALTKVQQHCMSVELFNVLGVRTDARLQIALIKDRTETRVQPINRSRPANNEKESL